MDDLVPFEGFTVGVGGCRRSARGKVSTPLQLFQGTAKRWGNHAPRDTHVRGWRKLTKSDAAGNAAFRTGPNLQRNRGRAQRALGRRAPDQLRTLPTTHSPSIFLQCRKQRAEIPPNARRSYLSCTSLEKNLCCSYAKKKKKAPLPSGKCESRNEKERKERIFGKAEAHTIMFLIPFLMLAHCWKAPFPRCRCPRIENHPGELRNTILATQVAGE
jgi:hypothetical protein